MSVLLGSVGKIDKDKVREVILFAENNPRLYDVLINVYLPNLKKKKKSGKYDSKLAVKLLEYYYSNYVRGEMIKPSVYGFDPKLNPAERKMFAENFVEELETNYL
jgi:hypothetical protein